MLKYNYSNGKLTKFTHLEDNSLICLNKVNYEFVYNTNNLLSSIKDGESNLYSIEYNSNKATKVKYPNNEYYTLNYSDELTTVTKTNENGKNIYTEKTNFDTDTGKILIETDTDNNKVNYFYENSNNKYLLTKTSKIVDYQELNSNNELVNKTKVVVTTTNYNENEDIVEEVDENGNTTEYNYETNEHQPTSIITTSKNNEIISNEIYEYDDFGNLEKERDCVNNVITNNKFNSNGQIVVEKETNTETNKVNSTLGYEYDELGNVQVETTNNANVETSQENEYDSLNRLTDKTISNSNGSVNYLTIYSYEDLNDLNRITTKTATENNLYCEKTYKNNLDEPTEIKYYDKNGNLVREKSNGVYKDYIYDNNKNAIITLDMTVDNDGKINQSDKKISLALYDENGHNTTNVQNASISNETFKATDNSIITKSEYDEFGNVIKETDAEGIETTYTYDSESKLNKVILGSNKSLSTTTIVDYSFDSNNNSVVKTTDANGNVHYETKNAADLTISTVDEGDPNDLSDNIQMSYNYDKDGNVEKETFSNGDYKTYTYNPNNQLTQTVYWEKGENESGKETLKTEYSYDSKGNIISMVDFEYNGNDDNPYHYTYYEYDVNNNMIGFSEINKSSEPSDGEIANHKLTYKYDVEGNVSEIVYPTVLNDNITSIRFEYDEYYNWPTKILAKINEVYKDLRVYSYNNDGTIKNIKDINYDTNGNADGYILKKYTYDDLGRVSTMKYYDDSDTMKESYSYTYDKNSNIKSEEVVNNYPTNNSDKLDEKKLYEYDSLGRLTNSAIVNNKNKQTYYYNYTYDKVGNMLSKAEILSDTEKNATVYTYNDLNQLISSVTSNIVSNEQTSNKTYTYDKNGNNTKEVDNTQNITKVMTYDVDNRLNTYTKTENNKTVTQNNLYNGNGQRIQKTEGDNTINYYYQGGNVLYTTDSDENKTSHNLVGLEGNTISTMRYNLTGLEYFIYNKDIKGSTTNLVDNNQNAKISYTYSDFGETEEHGNTDFYNEICYTGGIYDESTALYYLNARYYNPEDARFITQDTYRGSVKNPNSLHLYTYCANNPVNYTDPSGHRMWAISRVVSAHCVIGVQTTKSIVVSTTKRIGIAKSAEFGVKIGGDSLSASLGLQLSVYPTLTKFSQLKGTYMNANISLSMFVFNASAGVSISQGESPTPYISGGVSGTKSLYNFKINPNLYAGLGYGQSKAFDYSIDYYKNHRKGKKCRTWKYNYFGEKQKIEAYKNYVEVTYSNLKLRIYSPSKVERRTV